MSLLELESFFSDGGELLTSAARRLVDCGCCPRCVLRFLGDKQTALFRHNDQELRRLLLEICTKQGASGDTNTDLTQHTVHNGASESDSVNKEPTPACIACYGILQEECIDQTINDIIANIEGSQYQFNSFICSVTVPVSTLIRKHSLWIYMKESYSDIYSNESEMGIADIKEVWKWRCGPLLADRLNVPFDPKSKFSVSVTFCYDKSHAECNFLRDLKPDQFTRRKMNKKSGCEVFTRPSVTRVLEEVSDEKFKSHVQTPPTVPAQCATCGPVVCEHEPVYIAGRYNKYSRHLSQTPWIIDGLRKSQSSVEELISRVIIDNFRPKDSKFSSSGREDVDVRMLGRGRPFVLELIDPHAVDFSPTDMSDMQKAINAETDLVQVRDLQMVTREDTSALKVGEETKRKVYTATCWAVGALSHQHMEKLSTLTDIVVKQKTPIRVLHRRNLATREKTIHSLHGEIIDEHHFKLKLSTQAGTYIKEFVHSDFGRTSPSLRDFLDCECDILELDVEEVEIDWPKALDNVGLKAS